VHELSSLLNQLPCSPIAGTGSGSGQRKEVRHETGRLQCEVCGFDFESVYGELGSGFAECHHTKPLADLRAAETTKVADLAIVCANCHRMIHRRRPWLSLDQLKGVIGRLAKDDACRPQDGLYQLPTKQRGVKEA
jgi:ribosomal protein L44E